ncbi:uncharacterized protein G2W53_020459 [Senna tora]|uniref:Uncharacterized protein n=1 Tax=Senna tora TaxID=362788 RepID=A0A834WMX6_9FABA|nr:uncharacterized protein G2W53_020459 [Senna tora]
MLCPLPYKLSQLPSHQVHVTIPRYKSSSSSTSKVSTNPNMDQQSQYKKPEIPDLSKQRQNFDNASTLQLQKVQKQKDDIVGCPVSEKELKIRRELEMEVERGLEEEIKDGIYNLSLRLHRLYQGQKERTVKCQDHRNRALSVVNISIRMEGKTKVEIKEIKKEANQKGLSRSGTSEDVKQVDWEKSLRAGAGYVSVNRTNGSSKQKDKIGTSGPNLYSNRKFDNRRDMIDGCSGKRDGKVDKKLLQLGWKV